MSTVRHLELVQLTPARVLAVLLGFLAGTLGGALAFSFAGPWSACLAIAVVACLIAWSAARGGVDPL